MPKLRVLSGFDIVRIFEDFGFSAIDQRGSHIKLRRNVNGSRETLVIPNHSELDRGTIVALYRQGTRYIPETELRRRFYTSSSS